MALRIAQAAGFVVAGFAAMIAGAYGVGVLAFLAEQPSHGAMEAGVRVAEGATGVACVALAILALFGSFAIAVERVAR